ncbi:hypothetical protein EW146_g5783 [Bondarzewia mesenterica]|uniref:Uncharacterized protein n=1 Tax=Bondarzewia mesenterica TaxID=1095465 RepID=A0A4S4LW51_9AGAM|nr:hypothetical protein EW146_g5783 [Bondarzewia mesenterica]
MDDAALAQLSRSEIQNLARFFKVKANIKTATIISLLLEKYPEGVPPAIWEAKQKISIPAQSSHTPDRPRIFTSPPRTSPQTRTVRKKAQAHRIAREPPTPFQADGSASRSSSITIPLDALEFIQRSKGSTPSRPPTPSVVRTTPEAELQIADEETLRRVTDIMQSISDNNRRAAERIHDILHQARKLQADINQRREQLRGERGHRERMEAFIAYHARRGSEGTEDDIRENSPHMNLDLEVGDASEMENQQENQHEVQANAGLAVKDSNSPVVPSPPRSPGLPWNVTFGDYPGSSQTLPLSPAAPIGPGELSYTPLPSQEYQFSDVPGFIPSYPDHAPHFPSSPPSTLQKRKRSLSVDEGPYPNNSAYFERNGNRPRYSFEPHPEGLTEEDIDELDRSNVEEMLDIEPADEGPEQQTPAPLDQAEERSFLGVAVSKLFGWQR